VDLRLVIIDDASNDGTWNIIKSYADRYPNVIAFRNDTNQGLIKTLKKLFLHIEGEYFSLADQDDVWDVNKLESSIGYMRQNLASLVYSDVRTIDGYGGVLQDRYLQNAKIKPHVGIDPIPFVFSNRTHNGWQGLP
jgi:glycosyltransferase involved in cell wall biosynthesis